MEFIQKVTSKSDVLIEITIKKAFDEKSSEFGGKMSYYTNCVVDYKGTEYYAKFTKTKYPLMVEGAKIMGKREVMNGSPYYDWFAGGDGLTVAEHPGQEAPVDDLPEFLKKETSKQVAPPKNNLELSIVTQSILHIDGYYDKEEGFKKCAQRATEDAIWFLDHINKQ